MSLDDRDLEEVALDVRDQFPVLYLGPLDSGLGRDLVRNEVDHSDLLPLRLYVEVLRSQPLDVDRASQNDIRYPGARDGHLAVLGHDLAALEDGADVEALEAVDNDEIGDVAGSYRPQISEPEVLGGVDRRQPDRRNGIQPFPHRHLHHVIYVPLLEEILGMSVIGHEEASRQIVARHGRQKVAQVLRDRALSYHYVHAQSELFDDLSDGSALVVGRHARRDVGVQILTAQPRSVSVYALVRGHRDLIEQPFVLEENAGVVHHLAEAQNPLLSQEGVQVETSQIGAAGLELSRGDTRGQHHVDVHRAVLRRVEDVVDSLESVHVRDLMRIAYDRSRAPRHHRSRELLNRDHRALYVHVPVDETREHVASFEVYLFLAPVVPDADDPTAPYRDVSPVGLSGEDVHDSCVPENEV